jgi:hypothetical protein
MVTPPKVLRCRAGIGRDSYRFCCCAERIVHVLEGGLGLATGIARLNWRCLMESRRPSSHTLPHQRARIAAIKAAAQPRQKAVGHGQLFSRLSPTPSRNAMMAHKIIKDFISIQLFSNIAAIKNVAVHFMQKFNVYRAFFGETTVPAPPAEIHREFFARLLGSLSDILCLIRSSRALCGGIPHPDA